MFSNYSDNTSSFQKEITQISGLYKHANLTKFIDTETCTHSPTNTHIVHQPEIVVFVVLYNKVKYPVYTDVPQIND